jgi:conjugative relaxase-like TrwC/TraI family protein
MTVRVTTLKGAEAGVYYVEHPPSYYLNAAEPAGIWHGGGASLLGLCGEVDGEAFISVMAGRDPASGVLLGRRYGEGSVRGFDVTASAPKSVSVLFAVGDDDTRRAVLAAHDAAVAAMVGWIEAHAHTRFRIAGRVAVVDAEGIVAAAFRQHTSRALDPQLHTHVVIANRVASPDGRWLALDARTLKLDQRTLSAIYHTGLRAELTARLGVGWEPPVNAIAEIAHVPADVLEVFSSRTADVQDRVAVKLDRFTDTMGRGPTARERWRLEREAVTDSRPSKLKAADSAELHRRWAEQVFEVGHDPQQLIVSATRRVTARNRIEQRDVARIVNDAMASLTLRQSTWRPAELVRELAAAVPTDIAVPPDQLVGFLDDLAGEVIVRDCVELSAPIPAGVMLRRDGRPISEAATDRALTTPAILAEEERVILWAERRLAQPAPDATELVIEPGGLSVPQLEAARTVAGTRALVLVVGAAGTGKTTALAPAVSHLHTEGRVVFGVAPSAVAAEVLREETAMAADTIDKLLVEHRGPRPPQPGYALPAGATLIVDEAAMCSTPHLAELATLADRRHWRLVLVSVAVLRRRPRRPVRPPGRHLWCDRTGPGATFHPRLGAHRQCVPPPRRPEHRGCV